MKHIIRLIMMLFCLLAAGQASAQVDVRLNPVRSEFLLGEGVAVKLKITNHTDTALVLSNSPERQWLHFTLTRSGSSQPLAPKAVPSFKKIVVNPGSSHEVVVNLRPYFYFNSVGSYKIVATVRMPDMQTTYSSNRASFTLANGGSVRSFAIQSAGKRLKMNVKIMRAGEKDCLFGQVVNADSGSVVGACYMGQYLNFMEPRVMMDRKQNLHVLCQSTPTYFTYSVMGTDGTRRSYQVLQRTGGPVDLITAGGGIKAIGLTPAKKPGSGDMPGIRDISER
ncbi:MAG: hypothetical protein IKV92_03890 [Akkermansia sp.]|nr:hypothetical protein [Akkermansia sp.]